MTSPPAEPSGDTRDRVLAVAAQLFAEMKALFPDNATYWVLGISPLSVGAIGAAINFAVAYVVSNATEAPPREIQDLVESIRVPRGAGAATDH